MEKLLQFLEQFTRSEFYNELIYRITFWFFGPGGSRLTAWFLLFLGFYLFARRRIYSYPALVGLYILSTIVAYLPFLFTWLKNIFF